MKAREHVQPKAADPAAEAVDPLPVEAPAAQAVDPPPVEAPAAQAVDPPPVEAPAAQAVDPPCAAKAVDPPPAAEAVDPPPAQAVRRVHGPHAPAAFSSPADILSELEPPECKLSLNANDWRWVSSFRCQSELFIDKLQAKFHTKTFDAGNWKSKLQDIHRFIWNKWDLIREQYPLPQGKSEQIPGIVPPGIFEQLAPIIQRLPPAKKYHSSSSRGA